MSNKYTDYHSDVELGAIYTKSETTFRVFSPYAEIVLLNLYKEENGNNKITDVKMIKNKDCIWETTVKENLNGIYYTYTVIKDDNVNETIDIYAKACGVNGKRGMIINLSETDPQGFRTTLSPQFNKITDAVIYELHIRDFSIDESSGCINKGKYLAFCEQNTVSKQGEKTCLSHVKELGVTHVHLLPSFDYASVNEDTPEVPQFNWGYDPQNYNIPEGSYSTDAHNPIARIKEFKQMVMALHKNGIRVIMDVVYNHTYSTEDSCFNLTVPEYYYRTDENGFTNGSGCGNETASEHSMVRKYIVDSVKYWAEEYKIDGFRFDLMAVHDIDTMNEISQELKKIDESIIVYGEGWVGGPSALAEERQSNKFNASETPDIAYFSDDMRDVIKGSVFVHSDKGFVNGKGGLENDLKIAITASTDNEKVSYKGTDKRPWAMSPAQVINYCEAHDNLTLWDKLYYSAGEYTACDRIKMDKLAAAVVFLSQGVPFIQAGQEFLRSKPTDKSYTEFEENSYKSSDFVNSIKWERKTEYKDVYEYYKGLIAFRKSHNLLRLNKTEQINNHLKFFDNMPLNTVAFSLFDGEEEIIVIFNASTQKQMLDVCQGEWNVYIDGEASGNNIIKTVNDNIEVEPISAMVLVKKA